MMRVTLNPEALRWARERAGRTVQDLAAPFPKLDRWERGEERPTLKQVERFAKAFSYTERCRILMCYSEPDK